MPGNALWLRNPEPNTEHDNDPDIHQLHGLEVRKPIPSYHIYKGTVFELVDQASDFVMSKINRAVIPRDGKAASDVEYELPWKAVREAIVNAVTHRDYTSNASVSTGCRPICADTLATEDVRCPRNQPTSNRTSNRTSKPPSPFAGDRADGNAGDHAVPSTAAPANTVLRLPATCS
jgi:hypothetical protein